MKQQTLAKSFSLEGVGLHTGKTVIIEFEPAEVNHGIRFMRVDMQDQRRLKLKFEGFGYESKDIFR